MEMAAQVMPLGVGKVTPSDTCQMKSSSKNIQPTAQSSFSSFGGGSRALPAEQLHAVSEPIPSRLWGRKCFLQHQHNQAPLTNVARGKCQTFSFSSLSQSCLTEYSKPIRILPILLRFVFSLGWEGALEAASERDRPCCKGPGSVLLGVSRVSRQRQFALWGCGLSPAGSPPRCARATPIAADSPERSQHRHQARTICRSEVQMALGWLFLAPPCRAWRGHLLKTTALGWRRPGPLPPGAPIWMPLTPRPRALG